MKKGFSKDFYLVLIGQIISLFGNAVIRFALPLHLLSVTHSPSLLGIVSGFAFLPLAVMSPVGGLIADRVNKRNIMVVLDFFTAGLVLAFLLLSGRVSLVGLILVMLFLLYGISGAYQPSVQASIPLLVTEEAIMPANALINMISSLSALMELFIHIPFTRKERTCSLFRELAGDIKESLLFITREKKEIGKLTLCCTAVNFFLSALMIISLPVIVMQILSFPKGNASEMYGFLQALMAAGGLAGGMAAGIFSKKLNIRNSWKLLFASSLLLIPMGAALQPAIPAYAAYTIIALSGLLIMALASLYTIQIMSYIQLTTPAALTGKVISWIIALSSCAQPAGQIMYGLLLEHLQTKIWLIFTLTALLSMLVSYWNKQATKTL
ncbi:Major Facilitator Superfamily protein [Lachnospiraceae bacterium NLAE-zl-G231]|nr:Major Facilitator Superfamily protein [Lachnospiraceae bacterium NLAE-zl-G231]